MPSNNIILHKSHKGGLLLYASYLIWIFLVEESLVQIIKVGLGVAISFGRNPLDLCLTVVLIEPWRC